MLPVLLFVIALCHAQSDVAATVESIMDRSVDPCADFWSYSCGSWIQNTSLPPTKSQLTRSFTLIGDNNQEILKQVCEDKTTGKLNVFYSSCLDMASINAAGAEPIRQELAAVDEIRDVQQLMKTLAAFKLSGVGGFFSFGAVIDSGDPTQVIGGFDQGGLSVPYPEFYTAQDEASVQIRKQYEDTMVTLFSLIKDRDPVSSAKAALALESKIASFTVPDDQLSNPFDTYNRMTVPYFSHELSPHLEWGTYFDSLSVSQHWNVTVSVPSFYSNISVLIRQNQATWKPYLKIEKMGIVENVKANHFRWKILVARASLLSDPFRTAYFNFFSKVLGGQSEPEPLWRQCVANTDASLGELTGKYFLQKAFPGTSLDSANADLKGIMDSMKADIEGISWMDPQTKIDALAKLALVQRMIGGPANPRTYDDVTITSNYYRNIYLLAVSSATLRLAGIGKGSDRIRDQWDMTAATVNAYYDPTKNQMVFPAGILQQPFFNNSFPMEMNLGGIGMVMGHELTHGFDNQGRLYDGHGRLVNWWQPQTSKLFDEKVQCVIDQYSTFEPLPGVFINGKLTQGENVADMGGINNAFKTARTFLGQDQLKAPSIVKGLTRGQLFFVAFAQTWCTIASPESIKLRIKTDPHSPAQFRVLGPLINLPEFSETFSCPVGSRMNPTKRCQVW